jgi:hypothetical protein
MFRATFRPSSGALLNCSRSLRFPYKSRGGWVYSRGLFVNKRETETAVAVKKCSWWWAECCPKNVEQRLNNKRFYNWVWIWLVVLFEDLNMHGTTNHKYQFLSELFCFLISFIFCQCCTSLELRVNISLFIFLNIRAQWTEIFERLFSPQAKLYLAVYYSKFPSTRLSRYSDHATGRKTGFRVPTAASNFSFLQMSEASLGPKQLSVGLVSVFLFDIARTVYRDKFL